MRNWSSRSHIEIEQIPRDVAGNEGNVGVLGEGLRDVEGGFQLLNLDLCGTIGLDCLVDEFGCLGFCLRSNDLCIFELLIAQHDEFLHLCQLLLDCLLFDSPRVLHTKTQMHETHVLYVYVELLGTGVEAVADLLADGLTGFEKLVGVV